MKLEDDKFRTGWRKDCCAICVEAEELPCRPAVQWVLKRADVWVGGVNAETWQTQERVCCINWVELLSLQAKDDL